MARRSRHRPVTPAPRPNLGALRWDADAAAAVADFLQRYVDEHPPPKASQVAPEMERIAREVRQLIASSSKIWPR